MALKETIGHNFVWKLVSLGLAILVWFSFRTGDFALPSPVEDLVTLPGTREIVRHPVSVMKYAGDERDFEVVPEEVDLTLSGDLSVLRNLSGQDVRAVVDLTSRKEDLNSVKVQIYAPPGVKLERATPPEVKLVVVEPQTTK